MASAVRSWRSLRVLLVVMIGAPILPTIVFAVPTMMRLAQAGHEIAAAAAIALAGAGVRVLGGIVALLAAARIIRSIRALSQAAGDLEQGETAPKIRSGIAEIDNVIQAMNAAARSLSRRSQEQARAEAALRDSESRLRDFAETGSDWYWETDRQHRFTYSSPDIRIFGQDPSSRIGRIRLELASDAESEPGKWRDHMATLNCHERFRDFVYTRRVGTQPEHTVAVSGKPFFDMSGRFAGYRGSARDISEQVRAERALREAKTEAEAASLAKSRFLANMSHELRTPLNAVLGFSEMLERGTAGALAQQQLEYVSFIRQSGAHLLEIINEILDLAKIDAGTLELDEDKGVDVRSLADACVTLIGPRARAGGLSLSVEIENRVPPIVADATRLKQILLNLLGNAVKFTDPGGTIVLAVRRTAAGGVEFEVRDTGLGMTAAEIGIAVEPFGQVDADLARRHEGAGLGLPLARRLTELHGGSLRIESEKGRGTRVAVTLPPSRVLAEPEISAEPGVLAEPDTRVAAAADRVRAAAPCPAPADAPV